MHFVFCIFYMWQFVILELYILTTWVMHYIIEHFKIFFIIHTILSIQELYCFEMSICTFFYPAQLTDDVTIYPLYNSVSFLFPFSARIVVYSEWRVFRSQISVFFLKYHILIPSLAKFWLWHITILQLAKKWDLQTVNLVHIYVLSQVIISTSHRECIWFLRDLDWIYQIDVVCLIFSISVWSISICMHFTNG